MFVDTWDEDRIAREHSKVVRQRDDLRKALIAAKRVIPIHLPEWEQARAALKSTEG